MKRVWIRFIALVLLLGLVSQSAAFAVDTKYQFPNDWSRDALIFAVENGIYRGNEHGDLEPSRATTRAEMAAVLVRLMGLKGSADLSAYKDVNPKAWYYPELSAAVAAGIFNGLSASQMGPNDPITREQTMTVFARAFGLAAWDQAAYQKYSDSKRISDYARAPISALQERGLVHGYTDGTIHPGSSIIRAEVAQLLYNFFDAIVTDPQAMPASGRVLYVGQQSLPQELNLDGSLLLAPGYQGTIGTWNIADELVLRCPGSFDLSGLTAGAVICAASVTVSGTPQVSRFAARAKDVVISCDLPSLIVTEGNAALQGNVDLVQIQGSGVALTGSGYAKEVQLLAKNASVSVNCGKLVDLVRHGLEGVSASLSQAKKVTEPTQYASITATFKGGIFTGPDTTDGKLICTLQWLCNGNVISEDKSFALYNGAAATGSIQIPSESENKVAVRLVNGSESLTKELQADVDYYKWDYDHALSTVKPLQIDTTMLQSTKLYKEQRLVNSIKTLSKGTVVNLEYHDLNGHMKVTTSDGITGWINSAHASVTNKKVTNSALNYSVGTKEGFVNLNGYDSSTSYLIWVSCLTQRVNLYQGSKGKWKLVNSFLVSTGDNDTPTPVGVYSTYYHEYRWKYDNFYVDTITGFHGGHAFHSILYAYDGSIYNNRVGISQSHGCVRMLPDDVKVIYNLPMGTRVVVY